MAAVAVGLLSLLFDVWWLGCDAVHCVQFLVFLCASAFLFIGAHAFSCQGESVVRNAEPLLKSAGSSKSARSGNNERSRGLRSGCGLFRLELASSRNCRFEVQGLGFRISTLRKHSVNLNGMELAHLQPMGRS